MYKKVNTKPSIKKGQLIGSIKKKNSEIEELKLKLSRYNNKDNRCYGRITKISRYSQKGIIKTDTKDYHFHVNDFDDFNGVYGSNLYIEVLFLKFETEYFNIGYKIIKKSDLDFVTKTLLMEFEEANI